jgi:hypothetical protein
VIRKRQTLPRVMLSPHAKDRARERIGERVKMASVRGKLMQRLPDTLRSGAHTDWDGAVHVRIESNIWAVCYPMLEGGWMVSTIYRQGEDEMEKCKSCSKSLALLERIYRHWCELEAAIGPQQQNVKLGWLSSDMSDVREVLAKGGEPE